MGCIGTPDEYEAIIVDSLTQETLTHLKWSTIRWQRTRNQTSTGTVTIAPYDTEACNGALTGLTAWGNMLAVIRNGQRVWDGPVVGWSVGDGVTISARDRSAMLAKRLVGADLTLPNVPLTYDLYDHLVNVLLTDAGMYTSGVGQMPYDFNSVSINPFQTGTALGVWVAGKWRVASLETIASVFSTLVETAYFNWGQVMTDLNCWVDGFAPEFVDEALGYGPQYAMAPTLSSSTIVNGKMKLTVQADDLVTGVYKGTTGQGVAGFVNPAFPGLDSTYIPYGLYGAYTDAEVGVGQFLDTFGVPFMPGQYDSGSPTATLEEVQLRPEFGGQRFKDDLSTMLPGSIWNVDFPYDEALNIPFVRFSPAFLSAEWFTRISAVTLEQLDVSVSRTGEGFKETMSASVRAFS